MLNILVDYCVESSGIGLNFNQMPFFGKKSNDVVLWLRGISVLQQGSTSYLVNSSVKANFITISANRFPENNYKTNTLHYH